ncbi:MAG: hypothetical protein ACFCU1_03515 [Sumerlaeia bacterium]
MHNIKLTAACDAATILGKLRMLYNNPWQSEGNCQKKKNSPANFTGEWFRV